MSDSVVCVEGLGKRYRISGGPPGLLNYRTLRETLYEAVRLPLYWATPGRRQKWREFWALRDVSFRVCQGEVLGVIGPNGAGKTTLFKILSRITEPSEGRVELRGRVASLLEVGTGFHPELTGRENIFLNGAILGMTRAEIRRKFDEIVAFSEVETFLDTPVKRYSSGMYVRLAFAVAAHLESEILLVDEVLAVGDVSFQRKCMQKMSGVAHSGRTVLFVSHNMNAVQSLCNRALYIAGGRLVDCGSTDAVVSKYLTAGDVRENGGDLADHPGRSSGSQKVFKRLLFLNEAGEACTSFPMGGDVRVRVDLALRNEIKLPIIGLGFRTSSGHNVAIVGSFERVLPNLKGTVSVCGTIPNLRLAAGDYSVVVDLRRDIRTLVDRVEDAARLFIEPRDLWGTGWLPSDQNRC